MELLTNNDGETRKAGEEFGKTLSGGYSVFLYGNLGAGKTTFMQGLARGLGITHRIISPTFIIVRSYEIPGSHDSQQVQVIQKLYHVDLYRTQTRRDLEGVGLFDMLNDEYAVVAIEWPEKFGIPLPEKRYDIYFETLNENTRKIKIEKYG